jgi:hypothetical protein
MGWQGKMTRVSRMDWEEIRTRAQQEFHKRSDLVLHQLGVRNGTVRLGGNGANSAVCPGQFFVATDGNSAGEGPGNGPISGRVAQEFLRRADLLRKHLPHEAAKILQEADEICAHRFDLLGYEKLDYGSEIDWHLDRVHGKRAPLAPWFKIPFLDFAAVGDHKVTWELNRHQSLVTLAKARLLTGDQKYVRELIAQWHSWFEANPYPLGINWASTLEVAFRSLSWIWFDQMLTGSPDYDQFRGKMTAALAFHGSYIERYLSTYFSPNTHLLGEALALFFLGTLYPQMPGAQRWLESGWQIVLREAGRQVRPDGVYFEQSVYYHVYALDFCLYARLLAGRNGMEIPQAYDAIIGRMLDVVAALSQAGPAEGFGDDDGGRLWNPRRNQVENMTDPLALGALIYSKNFSSGRLTEEAIWLFGERAVDELPRENSAKSAQSVAFPDGGLYVLADSHPYRQTMVVDAGPHGVDRAGHGHADALSVRLTMDGQRWLVDAGSGVYISDNPADRNALRGTAAHNTMRVDGVDQAIAHGPFSWTHIPTSEGEVWIAGKSFTYFVGSHDGYARLADPVVHRRHVLKIAEGPWLVRDMALGREEHELEIRWHFAPDLEVRSITPESVAISRFASERDDSGEGALSENDLHMVAPKDACWQPFEISETLISPAYGTLLSAPLVRRRAKVLLPAETATALLAECGRCELEGDRRAKPGIERKEEQELKSTNGSGVQVYELHYANQDHTFCFALGDAGWSFGRWSSDASVLCCRIENERLAHLIVIGGTEVRWQGQPLLEKLDTSAFFEWRRQESTGSAQSSNSSVTPLFEELTGEELARDTRD